MILRTVQLIGQVYGKVNLTVTWDGEQVFTGSLPQMKSIAPVCVWSYPAKKFGSIPMQLAITGPGKLIWVDIHMNYTGDYECLPGSQSSGGIRITPQDFFASPANQNASTDGKLQVSINGNLVKIDKSAEDIDKIGPWHYKINSGETLSCLYRVDRQKLRLYTPTFDY